MLPVEGRLRAVGFEQVPGDREGREEVDRIAFRESLDLGCPDLGPELDPVILVGRAGTLTGPEAEPVSGLRIREPAHGIVATAFVNVNVPRPPRVES